MKCHITRFHPYFVYSEGSDLQAVLSIDISFSGTMTAVSVYSVLSTSLSVSVSIQLTSSVYEVELEANQFEFENSIGDSGKTKLVQSLTTLPFEYCYKILFR